MTPSFARAVSSVKEMIPVNIHHLSVTVSWGTGWTCPLVLPKGFLHIQGENLRDKRVITRFHSFYFGSLVVITFSSPSLTACRCTKYRYGTYIHRYINRAAKKMLFVLSHLYVAIKLFHHS